VTAACTNGIDIGFASLNYAQIGFLGVVQGITELLPISSTAHMCIVPALLGWTDPGSAFSAIMQLAALAAVLSYFAKDVRALLTGSVLAVQQRDFQSPPFRMFIAILLATIPIGVAGLLLSSMLNACNTQIRSLQVIAIASIVMAALLAISELTCKHVRRMEQMRLRDALWVGLAQVGALIPGVSRSGSTLTGAMFLNFRREDAAQFSFLLGLPAIALAGLKELLVLWHAHIPLDAWLHLLLGLVVGSASAFAAIWGLMKFLERFSTWIFVVYRGLLGIILLFALNAGWLV
jgi:undecaprenyl-diphosphatase